jgi:hypothetical protein
MQTDSTIPSAGVAQVYIAELMAHLGPHLRMIYTDTLSYCFAPNVGLCLDTMLYNHSAQMAYEFATVLENVYNNRPVYIQGEDLSNPSEPIGHAWVIDGAMVRSVHLMDYQNGTFVDVGRTKISRYVHCNWGLDGRYNGYYTSGVFDLSKRKYPSNVTRTNLSENNIIYYNILPITTN